MPKIMGSDIFSFLPCFHLYGLRRLKQSQRMDFDTHPKGLFGVAESR